MEIVVSFFIIALLTAILMANYHSTNQRSQLNIIRQQIISDIRLAQNYCLGAKQYNGSVPEGGWGLAFDSTTSGNPDHNTYYRFFADTSGDHRYDNGEANPVYGGKTIFLPSGYTISNIKINGSNRDTLEITYEPPDPIVTICRPGGQNQCDGNTAVITIADNTGQTKTITLNNFGLVDPN